jgi:hypothetical protein
LSSNDRTVSPPRESATSHRGKSPSGATSRPTADQEAFAQDLAEVAFAKPSRDEVTSTPRHALRSPRRRERTGPRTIAAAQASTPSPEIADVGPEECSSRTAR